ncbi:MAG: hypothetical protein GY797_06145 [Deltaproteobacteria bacterium]|nr:hypothetical protein [Deltaproteobacteria bacterium]
MNTYLEMKNRQQEEFNAFPCFFAFNNQQFEEGMEKLGLESTDTDKVYKGVGGMIYKKTESPALKEMTNRHTKEREDAIEGDAKGDGYIFEMFRYELANHEYGYTCDDEDTIDALGLTHDEIEASPALKEGLHNAKVMVSAEFMGLG